MPAGIFFDKYSRDMAFLKWPVHYVGLAVGMATLYLWPLAAGYDYLLRLAIWIAAWSMAAAGLNVLFGLTGQISLAQGAFMALGAFTSIWLATHGVPPLLAIPLAGLLVTTVGLLFGLPSLRLKELYLLISTLAAQFVIDWLLKTERMAWFTGGAYAKLAPPLTIGPITVADTYGTYVVILTVAVLHLAALANIGRSYIGRAFNISAYMAAVGGALWAFAVRSVTVESFTFFTSLEVLAAVLIGGLGRVVWGSVLGTVFIIGVPEAIKMAFLWLGVRGIDIALRDAVFGALILAFLLYEPLGLTELLKKIKERIRLFPFRYY